MAREPECPQAAAVVAPPRRAAELERRRLAFGALVFILIAGVFTVVNGGVTDDAGRDARPPQHRAGVVKVRTDTRRLLEVPIDASLPGSSRSAACVPS